MAENSTDRAASAARLGTIFHRSIHLYRESWLAGNAQRYHSYLVQTKYPNQPPTAVPPATFRSSWLALLAITLFAIPVIRPLLSTAISCGFDTVFHLWRAFQIGSLWEQGVWFSRWAPEMAHGYGYPLYLYQSPLSAAAVALFNKLGLPWPLALNAIYALATLASGWSSWLLARSLWGERGALITAVAYLYAPFHAYVLYYRASLSETVAWAILPLLLWGLLHWQQRRSRTGFATAVAALILLILCHDVTVYAALPLLAGWVATIALHGRSWPAFGRGTLALALGLGGSAFFWLPTFLERSAIQFERANSAWPFWYSNNFLPLHQLLASPRNADPTLLNDWPERGLGWLLLLLAFTGVWVAWRQRPWHRWLTLFLLAGLLGYITLTVAVSRPLWDMVDLLQTFQFPWRFLAPATLLAAILAGGVGTARWHTAAAPLTAVALLALLHLGWFYPTMCAPPNDITRQGMVAWELASDTIGTTASRELLPVTVQQIPSTPADFPLALQNLPPQATLHQHQYQPLRATLDIETAVPFTATLQTFYFAGWRAWVDGQPAQLSPSQPDGLLSVPIPAGRHTLTVAFGEAPAWLWADGLSLLSVVAAGWLLWRYGRREAVATAVPPDWGWYGGASVAALLLCLMQWSLVDGQYTPLRSSRLTDGQLTDVAHISQLTFGQPANPAQIRLLGMDAWPTAVAADQPLPLTLYWQALQPLDQPYRVGLALVDEHGIRWTAEGLRDDRWRRAAPPTQQWLPGHYVQTALLLDSRQGTPPGDYALYLSLFHQETLAPLTIYENGQAVGPQILLGQVQVLPPKQAIEPVGWAALHQVESITVYQAQFDRQTAAAGDTALLTMLWQTESSQATEIVVTLADSHGRVQQQWPMTLPAYGRGVWLSQQLVPLAAGLRSDTYEWQLLVGNAAPFAGGTLQIEAPERLFTPPAMQPIAEEVLYEDGQPLVALVGVAEATAVCQVTTACPVQLVWQVMAETRQNYRVFVHVVDGAGQLVAQSDGIMSGWTRPSTGWVAGEFLVDPHTLAIDASLAAGTYRLVAGVYGADGRLQTAVGRDQVVVGELVVE